MNTTANSVSGIDCVCYLAKDFERARSFYDRLLAIEPTTSSDAWREYELADGTAFAIACMPDGTWYQTGGAMFAVADLEAALERARAAGAKVHGEIADFGVCRTVWCDDTEGNNFALHRRANR